MAIVRESDRGIRIRSFGREFQRMLLWGGCALLLGGFLAYERNVPWYLYALVGFTALVGLSGLIGWLSVPRVVVDTRLRLIILGDERMSWDAFDGIYRSIHIERGPRGSKIPQYTLRLAKRDESVATRIAVTTSDEESTALQRRLAGLIGIEMLPDRPGTPD